MRWCRFADSVIVIVGLTVGAAAGQSMEAERSRTERGESSQRAIQGSADDERGLLAGPRVREDRASGEGASFGAPMRGQQASISAQVWLRILERVDLTPVQREQIAAIRAEFEQAVREHRRVNGPRLRELEAKRRELRAAESDLPPEDHEALRALYAAAPREVDQQQRIWMILSGDQQDEFRAVFNEHRLRLAEQRRRAAGGDDESEDAAMRDGPAMDSMTSEGMMEARQPMRGREPATELAETTAPRPATQLDEAGHRRLEFLRSRQQYRERGRGPTESDRIFRFDDIDHDEDDRG